jgi:hypothetical protein
MIQHRDHGSISGPAKPQIRMSPTVTTKCSPFFLSVNCLTGNYKGNHSSNFAYKTQQTGEIGTCATIGPPPVTYSGDNDLYTMAIYAGMFPEGGQPPERQLGMSHVFGHLKSQSHSRTYMHIWGDALTTLSIGDMEPFIKVTTPNENLDVEQNSVCMVGWADNIKGKVKIELLKGTAVNKVLINETESNGKFEWNVPEDQPLGNDYKIKITSIDDPTLSHTSEQPFKVIPEYIISKYPYTLNLDNLTSGSDILPEKWTQLDDDNFNWTVLSGPTPSKQYKTTGPDADHTTNSGNYIYMEASDPNFPGKKANIISPKFDFRNLKDGTFQFYYHMFSDSLHMGELHLDIAVDGQWTNDVVVLNKENYGDQWNLQEVPLNNYRKNRVVFRFRGITGKSYASDICLDDFKIDGEVVSITNTMSKLPSTYNFHIQGQRLFYQIPGNGTKHYPVSIKLYNLHGKMVKELVNENLKSGFYSINLQNNIQLAAGIYQCRMKSNKFVKTLNLSIIK